MAISNTISVAEDKFNQILSHTAAQRTSRIRSKVRNEAHYGEVSWYKIVSDIDGETKTSRNQQINWQDPDFIKQRGVQVSKYLVPTIYDRDDENALSFSPASTIFEKTVESANRWLDDQIITALDADVIELDRTGGNTAYSTQSFDSAQSLDADGGGNNSSLNHEKLEGIHDLFGQNEATEDEVGMPCLVVSQHELTQLAREIRNSVTFNGDYSAQAAVQRIVTMGEGEYFGFHVIRSQRLKTSGEDRKCFAWYPSAVIWSNAQDIQTKMQEDINVDCGVKQLTSLRGGALRLNDEKVVRQLCDSDATYNAA